ncbi:MAG: hypothetical protein LPL00_07585 [Alphaproteobacteria bacterium]|nr:hypothetical protein [Alphaproteobacteria bacterium]MDX5369424.1 hypothetical protein [Alphaproteobacteria bacterium]MDX5464108.1 hypothetical protein [Alphaproteobacteria bacterium]
MSLILSIAFLALAIVVFFSSVVGLRHPRRPAWTNAFGVAELAAVLSSILFACAGGFLFKHAITNPGALTWAEDAAVIAGGALAIAAGWRLVNRAKQAAVPPAGAGPAHG